MVLLKNGLTGWHVLGAMVAFFGVIFAVNGFMTYQALSTFSGIETPNAYQVGRDFNQTLEAAEAQRARGWQVTFDETFVAMPDGTQARVVVTVADAAGSAVSGLDGTLTFWRPVVQGKDVVAVLTPFTDGTYVAEAVLPARGTWDMRLSLEVSTAMRADADTTPYYLEKRVFAGGPS